MSDLRAKWQARIAANKVTNGEGSTGIGIDAAIAAKNAELSAERARADSLTASIVKACDGTGCVNAHELAEALRQARSQLDTYIKTAADAVAEQGRCEAAGRVLAAEVYDFAAALAYDTGQDVLTHVSEDVKSNPLALAWVRQAQEASNG